MVGKGQNGLSVRVANQLFENIGIKFEDRKQLEGSYIAIHPDGIKTIRRGRVTEVTKAVIESWFKLIQ
jgi:hypothetical protein